LDKDDLKFTEKNLNGFCLSLSDFRIEH